MKTALEELIEEFEQLKKTKLYAESFKAIDDCIYLAIAKLEREKEMITEVYKKSKQEVLDSKVFYKDAEAFFKYNFKQI